MTFLKNGTKEQWQALKASPPALPPKLVEHDKKFKALSEALETRVAPNLSQLEMEALVEWKMSRGKWRPNLLKYARELSEDAVAAASSSAFAVLFQVPRGTQTIPVAPVLEALGRLTVLRGVGPATASAALRAYDPRVPYMGDEALGEVHRGAKLKYNVKEYEKLLKDLNQKAEELGPGWSAGDVEECIYWHSLNAKKGAAGGAASASPSAAPRGAKRSAAGESGEGEGGGGKRARTSKA